MVDPFEDHCWQDVVPADVLALYKHYQRDIRVGPDPALLAIDLYGLAYQGGALPIAEVSQEFPSSCGMHAWNAIAPTVRLFDSARAAGLPVFYTTSDTRPEAMPSRIKATNRGSTPRDPAVFDIWPDFKPHPDDVVIRKQRASGFFGTPLMAHLTQLGVRTVIICGESTSGCVRASAVDAYSLGLHVVLVEECCYDRSELSHKVNLFDLHHKYADVMRVADVVGHLDGLRMRRAG